MTTITVVAKNIGLVKTVTDSGAQNLSENLLESERGNARSEAIDLNVAIDIGIIGVAGSNVRQGRPPKSRSVHTTTAHTSRKKIKSIDIGRPTVTVIDIKQEIEIAFGRSFLFQCCH